MKKNEFDEITKQLWQNDYEYIYPNRIESIELKNGLTLYLPWNHCRIAKDNKNIYIKYGNCVPCGARIDAPYDMSFDRTSVRFTELKLNTDGNGEYRYPKMGDNLVYFVDGKIYKNSILDIHASENVVIITVAIPISGNLGGVFAFYDPMNYDKELYVLNNKQGVFLSFMPKTEDDFDFKIKFSDILKINVK